jgi:hypothetical protein
VYFDADLEITQGDHRVSVGSDHGDLVVVAERFGPLIGALRGGATLPKGGLRRLPGLLAEAGATVRLETPSSPVLTLGSGARSPAISRAIGFPHVRVETARGVVVALGPWRGRLAALGALSAGILLLARRRRI